MVTPVHLTGLSPGVPRSFEAGSGEWLYLKTISNPQSTVDTTEAEQMTHSYDKQHELRGEIQKVKHTVVHLSGVSETPEIFDGRTTGNSSSSSLPAMGLT